MAPILQKLILNREPQKVSEWVKKITKWPFNRIIPCHLSNNIKANPKDFELAFSFLYEKPNAPSVQAFLEYLSFRKGASLPADDIKFLEDVSHVLTERGVLYPEAKKIKY